MMKNNIAKKLGVSKKDAKKLVSLSRKNRSVAMISVKDAR